MNKEIIIKEIYQTNENGQTILVDTIEIEMEILSEEQIIAEKEAELLKIYAEIQALKTNQ